jgi:hypothetical protein
MIDSDDYDDFDVDAGPAGRADCNGRAAPPART